MARNVKIQTPNMTERLWVSIEPETKHKLRVYCASNETTQSDVTNKVLKKFLEETEK